MSETSAVRYLISKGWKVIEDEWLALCGVYDEPVCVETAYELQKMLDSRQAA